MSAILMALLPYLVPVLAGYVISAIERLLKIKLDAAARNTLDSAMQNGADWIISEGRMPTSDEVMNYVRRAAPAAVKRFSLDGPNAHVAQDRAKAVIARQVTAATAGVIHSSQKLMDSAPLRVPANAFHGAAN